MTTVYLNGEFLPLEQAHISPLDRGFLYGDGVYEVIRVYRGRILMLDEHFARLESSLAKMRMGAYLTPLHEVPKQLLLRNGLGEADALIYLQITRGAPAKRTHFFPPPDTKPTIFGWAWAFQQNPEWFDPGMTVITIGDDRWARCDIKTTALVPNSMANQRAKEAGGHEGIFIRDGAVTEGTLSTVWGVWDGTVRTPPLTNYILPGLKRQALLGICRDNGIPAIEAPIFEHELATADELFVTSTPYDLAPIHKCDGRVLPSVRPVTRRLMQLFAAFVAREAR
jgi:D-alanine transaminase